MSKVDTDFKDYFKDDLFNFDDENDNFDFLNPTGHKKLPGESSGDTLSVADAAALQLPCSSQSGLLLKPSACTPSAFLSLPELSLSNSDPLGNSGDSVTSTTNLPITHEQSGSCPSEVDQVDTDSFIKNAQKCVRSASSRRKRKFPGPAGVLPKLSPSINLSKLNVSASDESHPNIRDSQVSSSQSYEDCFDDEPWQRMLGELEDDAKRLRPKYSVCGIVSKASHKLLVNGKAPIACVYIESMRCHSNNNASVELRDPSGSIKGTVHGDLLKYYEGKFDGGSVLVLRQVAVISPASRRHYLNITLNNVVRIYYRNDNDEVECFAMTPFHEKDFQEPEVFSRLEQRTWEMQKTQPATVTSLFSVGNCGPNLTPRNTTAMPNVKHKNFQAPIQTMPKMEREISEGMKHATHQYAPREDSARFESETSHSPSLQSNMPEISSSNFFPHLKDQPVTPPHLELTDFNVSHADVVSSPTRISSSGRKFSFKCSSVKEKDLSLRLSEENILFSNDSDNAGEDLDALMAGFENEFDDEM